MFARSPGSFSRFLDQAFDRVYAYARYRYPSAAEAERVTRRALTEAREEWPRIGGSARPIVAVARLASSSPPGPAPERRAGSEGGRDPAPWLDGALERLDPGERELVALRYGARLSGSELLAVTGLSAERLERDLERALASLRALLAEPADVAGRERAHPEQAE